QRGHSSDLRNVTCRCDERQNARASHLTLLGSRAAGDPPRQTLDLWVVRTFMTGEPMRIRKHALLSRSRPAEHPRAASPLRRRETPKDPQRSCALPSKGTQRAREVDTRVVGLCHM